LSSLVHSFEQGQIRPLPTLSICCTSSVVQLAWGRFRK